MEKETGEKWAIAIALVVIVVSFKLIFNKGVEHDMQEKSRVESLEKAALKADSLEDIVSIYDIQDPTCDTEIDADVKEFTAYFRKSFSEDNLKNVVITGTPGEGKKLHWSIKVKDWEQSFRVTKTMRWLV